MPPKMKVLRLSIEYPEGFHPVITRQGKESETINPTGPITSMRATATRDVITIEMVEDGSERDTQTD